MTKEISPFAAKLVYLKFIKGEVIEDTYDVTVVKATGDGLLWARDHSVGVTKSFKLDQVLSLVDTETGEVLYKKTAPPSRKRSRVVHDPKSKFDGWYFTVERHHYETLGLDYRSFKKGGRDVFLWCEMEPVVYAFQPGHVFYGPPSKGVFMQIAALWDDVQVEVHIGRVGKQGQRTALLVRDHQIADWLRSGDPPFDAQLVDFGCSKAGLLAWSLLSGAHPPPTSSSGPA